MPDLLLPHVASDEEFELLFKDSLFGIAAAQHLCEKHGYAPEPVRVVAGSNLNFRVGRDHWLKICPPTNGNDAATEQWVLEHLSGRLPVRTPTLTASGELDGWGYLFITHIEGIAFDKVSLAPEERIRIATGVGAAMASLHALPIDGFDRGDSRWSDFLEHRLASVANRTRESGADETWTRMVEEFVRSQQDALRTDNSRVLTHADLYFDHLLLTRDSGRWEIAGIIDFADALVATREYELVDPILWLFRGERDPLVAMLDAFGMSRASMDADFARRMLAWFVVHRFHRFANAFKKELADASIGSMDDLAMRIFPIR